MTMGLEGAAREGVLETATEGVDAEAGSSFEESKMRIQEMKSGERLYSYSNSANEMRPSLSVSAATKNSVVICVAH